MPSCVPCQLKWLIGIILARYSPELPSLLQPIKASFERWNRHICLSYLLTMTALSALHALSAMLNLPALPTL